MRVVVRSELSSEIRRQVIMFIWVIDSRLCEVLETATKYLEFPLESDSFSAS